MNLTSERLDVDDYDEAVELFYPRNRTDGLPDLAEAALADIVAGLLR